MKKQWLALLMAALLILSSAPLALAAPPESGCSSDRGHGKHAWGEGDPVQPGCETPGYIYYYCQYCGTKYIEETEPPRGHDWGEWQQAATTSKDVRQCHRCGKLEYRDPATDHRFGSWAVDEPGTCLKPALLKRTCQDCGETEWRYGDLGDHQWGEWKTILEPTETRRGIERRVCALSGDHFEQRLIPARRQTAEQTAQGAAVSLEVATLGCMAQDGAMAYVTLRVSNTGTEKWTCGQLRLWSLQPVSPEYYDATAWSAYQGKKILPGEAFEVTIGVKVAPEDLARGEAARKLTVQVQPESGDRIITPAEDVVIYLTGETQALYVFFSDYEDRPYAIGESLEVRIGVTNIGKDPLTYKAHSVHLYPGESDPLAGLPKTLAPGETWYSPVYRTTVHADELTDPSAQFPGWFSRSFEIRYAYPMPVTDQEAYELAVLTCPIALGGETPYVPGASLGLSALCVTQEPLSFDFYGETDDILYMLTLINTGSEPCDVNQAEITTRRGTETVSLDSHPLAPGEYVTVPVEYRFTEEDRGAYSYNRNEVSIEFLASGQAGGQTVYSGTAAMRHQVSDEVKPWTPPVENTLALIVSIRSWPDKVGSRVDIAIEAVNTGDAPLENIGVWCSPGSWDKSPLTVIESLAPGETDTLNDTFVLTQDMVDDGSLCVYARAAWDDPDTGVTQTVWSEPCVMVTTKEALGAYPLYLEYTFLTQPKNGVFYQPGEAVSLQLYWENRSGGTLHDVTVQDFRGVQELPDYTVYYVGSMAPGANSTFVWDFTADDWFIYARSVYDRAVMTARDEAGISYERNASIAFPAAETTPPVFITKTEVSTPANGKYYTPGEAIEYRIDVQSSFGNIERDFFIFDSLAPDSMDRSIACATLKYPEECSYTLFYIVSEADAAAGKVVSRAAAAAEDGDGYIWHYTGEVVSPAGK